MAAEDHAHLLDALAAIDPATLDYSEWLSCGFALHDSGYSCQDWEDWSRRDHRRFHESECRAKWEGFGHGADKVSSGSIIRLAEARGWRQPTSGEGIALDWDDIGTVTSGPTGPDVTGADTEPIIDTDKGHWDPCRMLSDYLEALFEDDDHVGYVCECWERDGRLMPKRGHWDRTAGELRRELARAADLADVLGDWDERAGAWIRFNPLDGQGCGNANVTEFRYALVESDKLEMDRQFPAIKELHLPCAAVVSSAGKSVHAIVRVDAKDRTEYRKRVGWLYDYCDRHGFVVDRQNKNESRLSRLPGATRNGKRQLLLATNVGEESWDAWKKWAEESEDDLPDEIVGGIGEPVELNPMLIGLTDHDCILRKYSKMILVGDSKMGKSTTLIDLGEAICVGGEWLGMKCAQGKVYYINLELDENDFKDRLNSVWEKRPESGDDGMLTALNSRFVHMPMKGRADMLWDIAPTIVRRVLRYGPKGTFAAIIIDPIYKVNGGDDNDAKSVARFTNTLDFIAQSCGSAIIYAHHHPKGATGGRKAIDRMSGSGVYGRDADTVIDFSPLFAPEDVFKKFNNNPLFRAEIKCRSFGYRKPIDCVFEYPRFYRDDKGELASLKILGEDPGAEGRARGNRTNQDKATHEWEMRHEAVDAAYESYPKDLDRDEGCPRDADELFDLIEWGAYGLKEPTIETFKRWFRPSGKLHEYYEIGTVKTKIGSMKNCLIPKQ